MRVYQYRYSNVFRRVNEVTDVTGGAVQIVDKESATKLAAIRGHVWRGFGSPHQTNWFTHTSVFFCTEGPAITVSGWTDSFDF